MTVRQLSTEMCNRDDKHKHCRPVATASQVEADAEFQVWDQVLEKLDTFNYL